MFNGRDGYDVFDMSKKYCLNSLLSAGGVMNTILVNTIEDIKQRQVIDVDCRQMVERCGANTGNVCFCDTMLEQLVAEKRVWWADIDKDDGDGVYVIPASNWIRMNDNCDVLRRIALGVEKGNKRICVLGLGIQMGLDLDAKHMVGQLYEEVIKALKILSEHSVTLGIRGKITAEVLELIGISNYKIIGCPSFYEHYRLNGGG